MQQTEFATEMRNLINGKEIPNNSSIKSLAPFIDAKGILRVGGRLQNAQMSFDGTHQIIVAAKGRFTELVVQHVHDRTLHGGGQLMLAQLRQRYWIINAKNIIRQHIFKCITCHRHKATISTQLMGQLPAARVISSLPFSHTGVDYAGPLEIRRNKGRGSVTYKGYLAIFVCMAVKAVHVEVVTDLTTDGFIAAFRRFVSRRGPCSHLYSDCGTNFVGAARLLKQDLSKAKLERNAANILIGDGVQWHFNPPSAPNFGGIWEAAVKSTKTHLKKLISNANLTYEELTTVVIQIEAVLNSRPICPMTNDPSDLDVLTPGHFLIGRPLISLPEPSYLDRNEHRLNRWQRIQHMVQTFWNRWQTEYLHQLQQRNKWTTCAPNLAVESLVLIKDDRMPPSKWSLGRVLKVKTGKDGLVRVATVKTQTGEVDRPITKLCMLPMPQE